MCTWQTFWWGSKNQSSCQKMYCHAFNMSKCINWLWMKKLNVASGWSVRQFKFPNFSSSSL